MICQGKSIYILQLRCQMGNTKYKYQPMKEQWMDLPWDLMTTLGTNIQKLQKLFYIIFVFLPIFSKRALYQTTDIHFLYDFIYLLQYKTLALPKLVGCIKECILVNNCEAKSFNNAFF